MKEELKTLNDLIIPGEGFPEPAEFIYPENLKQEAIKWVKSMVPKKRDKLGNYFERFGFDVLIEDCGTFDFIVKFFNLSEEDLKSKK